jgi:hypothetical protein
VSPSQTEASKGELIELPNGLCLYYVDASHAYYRCNPDGTRGRRYTGVTTAIKPIDFEPDGLMKWAAKLNAVGVAQLVGRALESDSPEAIRANLMWLDPDNPARIWSALTDAKLTYEDIRDAKGVVGTNVHERVLRELAEGNDTPDYEGLTEQEKGYSHAVVDFWLDHNPQPMQVEQIVASEELGIAGRFDLRGTFQPCNDPLCPCHNGGIGLVDCKTGTWTSEKDHVQLALYSHTTAKCGFGDTDWTGILHVHEDGTYRLWEGEATTEMALDAVKLYRHRGEIRSKAGKARKARS